MKKFLKNAGLQIGVFALAIGAAFATNAMKNSNSILAEEDGYLQTGSIANCEFKARCSTIEGPVCTWQEAPGVKHQLYGLNESETSCTVELYQIMP